MVEGSEAEQALQLLEAEPGSRGWDAARAVRLHRPRRVPATSCIRADIGHCLGPCRVALDGEYHQAVEQARRVLEGDGGEVEEILSERQERAVEQLAFEQAGRLQAHRDTLKQALRLIRRLREAHETYALLVYPSRRAGRVNLYGVAAGRVVVERELSPRRFDHDAALAVLRDVYGAAPAAPPLPTEGVDELLLVHSWLRTHRHAVNVLSLWRPQADADDYEEQIADQLHLTASELLAKIRLVASAAGHPELDDEWRRHPRRWRARRTRSPPWAIASHQPRAGAFRQAITSRAPDQTCAETALAHRPPLFRPTFTRTYVRVTLSFPTSAGSEPRRNAAMSRGAATPIAVTWDRARRVPRSFLWRGRRYRVDDVLARWVVDTGWWNPATRTSRRYVRVVAEGRVFDLCYDRLRRGWFLERALN